jgi:MFS family permease
MIVTMFPEGARRSRALGVFAFVGAAGSATGLLAGGVLTDGFSWPWIFFINVPLGIAALVGTVWLVPVMPGANGRADLVGAVLVTTGVMLGVYAILAVDAGIMPLLAGVAALGLIGAFIVAQRLVRYPLLPLRLLTSRGTGLGNVVQAMMVAGLFGYQFLGALYLQDVLKYDAFHSGIAFLPVPLVIGLVSLGLTGRLVSRLGERKVLVVGIGSVAIGLFWLVRLSAESNYLGTMFPAGIAIAVGFGLAAPTIAGIAVGSAPPDDVGVASGLFNTAQQLGGAVGLAALTRLATVGAATHARPHGFRFAFVAAATATAVAALLAVFLLPRPIQERNG